VLRASARQWPALDGIRALAATSVVLLHVNYPHFFPGGFIGVDVFFVLSGFLITTLLVAEWDRGGQRFSLGLFYARRALRLLPALLLVVGVTMLVVTSDGAFANSWRPPTVAGVGWVLGYVGNWRMALDPQPALGALSHTWSLAIEEQFYVVWPLALALLLPRMRRMRLAVLMAGLATAAVLWREVLVASGHADVYRAYNGSDTHAEGLLLGGALALWISAGGRVSMGSVWGRLVTLAGVGSLVGVALFANLDRTANEVWTLLATLATVPVLLTAIQRPGSHLSRFLSWRPLTWVGARSYGLYLWHFPIVILLLSWTLPGPWPRVERVVATVIISFMVTAVSYAVWEQPFLKLKVRLRPRVLSRPMLLDADLFDPGPRPVRQVQTVGAR